MTKYTTFENKNYKIKYPNDLEKFTQGAIKIAMDNLDYLNDLFNFKSGLKLTADFFIDREDFVKHIQKNSSRKNIPDWVRGCFCNGSIQIFINKESEYELNMRKYTLLHETVHLYFNNLVYKKENIQRICWFDEAYAKYLDNSPKNLSKALENLELPLDFDMSSLSSPQSNAYNAFNLIGYYIFSTHQEKTLLKTLITDSEKIKKLGKRILKDSVNYIKENNLKNA